MTAASKNKDKLKKLAFENLTFFSLEDLPDQFNYFDMRFSIKSSSLNITSEDMSMRLISSNSIIEQKARNIGTDMILNIREVELTVQTTGRDGKPIKDIIGLGKNQKEDILSLYVKKEKKNSTIIGRVRRTYVSEDY